MGDISMYAPAVKLANILLGHNVPVYMYEFQHSSIHTPIPWWGTYHSLELDYVFGSPFNGFNLAVDDFVNHTEADRSISRTTMQLWTNFAKSGYVFYYLVQICASTKVQTNIGLSTNNCV